MKISIIIIISLIASNCIINGADRIVGTSRVVGNNTYSTYTTVGKPGRMNVVERRVGNITYTTITTVGVPTTKIISGINNNKTNKK